MASLPLAGGRPGLPNSGFRIPGAWAWFGSRLLQAAGVLLLAYTLTFALVNLLPSDPLSLRFAQTVGSALEQLAELNRY